MFSGKFTDVSLLREAMSAVAEIIDETELLIREDGWRMLASDRAVVAVVDFWLGKDSFSEYGFRQEARVGINLINLLRVLRRAQPNDVLSIDIDGKRMQLKLAGDSVRTFSLPLIDVTKSELPPLDHLEFASTMDVASEVLNSGIEDADLITDSLIFVADDEGLKLQGDSESAGFILELNRQSPGLKSITTTAPATARYSLDYLKRIIKARKLSETVKLQFSKDYPMKLSFDVPGKAQLAFVLAPRRED